MKIIQTLKEIFSNREHQSMATLNLSGAGFSSNNMHISWSDITEIKAYKIDNLTYDEMILEFVLSSGLRVRISEAMLGAGTHIQRSDRTPCPRGRGDECQRVALCRTRRRQCSFACGYLGAGASAHTLRLANDSLEAATSRLAGQSQTGQTVVSAGEIDGTQT